MQAPLQAPWELLEPWLEADYANTKFWIHLSSSGSCHTASNYSKLGIQLPQNRRSSARPSVSEALSPSKEVAIRKLQVIAASRELEAGSHSAGMEIFISPSRAEDRGEEDRSKARECSWPQTPPNCYRVVECAVGVVSCLQELPIDLCSVTEFCLSLLPCPGL